MLDYQARRERNPHSLPPTTMTLLAYVVPAAANDPCQEIWPATSPAASTSSRMASPSVY